MLESVNYLQFCFKSNLRISGAISPPITTTTFMATKVMFTDNTTVEAMSASGISKLEKAKMSSNAILAYMQAKYAIGDIICLLPGNMSVLEYGGHEFPAHRVAVFSEDGSPKSIELFAKSAHLYAHYGDGTEEMPLVGTRFSQKGNPIPDADLINSDSPFKFKVSIDGNEGSADVEFMQWARVSDKKSFWFSKYKEDLGGYVPELSSERLLPDGSESCVFERRRKLILEPFTPTKEMLKTIKTIL